MDSPLALVRRVRAEPRRRDAVDAAATAALGLLLIWLGMVDLIGGAPWSVPGWAQDPWWHALPLLLGCLAMVMKRRRPVTTVVLVILLLALDVAIGGSIGMYVVLVDALYCLVLHTRKEWVRASIIGIAIPIVAAPVATFVLTGEAQLTVFVLLQAFALLATPAWWGLSVRQHTELAELARGRAEDLQHLAELHRERAVRDERARMAQDLHDALSSHLSTIAIHSQVAGGQIPGSIGMGSEPSSAASREAERAGRSLAEIRTASVRALEDLREMILLLRTGEDQIVPAAGLADLATLVATARGTGLTVEVAGEPADVSDRQGLSDLQGLPNPPDLPDDLPSVVDQAAYRIVQESLANAAKHAPGSAVCVTVAARDEVLHLEVTCRSGAPGDRHTDATPVTGSGIGLQTMRDRAITLGGTFEAGPSQDGSWVVRAELPLKEVLVG